MSHFAASRSSKSYSSQTSCFDFLRVATESRPEFTFHVGSAVYSSAESGSWSIGTVLKPDKSSLESNQALCRRQMIHAHRLFSIPLLLEQTLALVTPILQSNLGKPNKRCSQCHLALFQRLLSQMLFGQRTRFQECTGSSSVQCQAEGTRKKPQDIERATRSASASLP